MATLALLAAGFALTSPAFGNGSSMPVRYTCDGADRSPPLRWSAPPAGTQTLAVRVVDLDTHPQYLHWWLTGIPVSRRGLAEGTRVGKAHENSFVHAGYGGPCPPPGQKHRYVFTLEALGPGAKVLARARLLVTFRR